MLFRSLINLVCTRLSTNVRIRTSTFFSTIRVMYCTLYVHVWIRLSQYYCSIKYYWSQFTDQQFYCYRLAERSITLICMESLCCIFLQIGLIQSVDHSLTIKELLQQRFSALNSPNIQYAVYLYCSIIYYFVFVILTLPQLRVLSLPQVISIGVFFHKIN